MTKIVNRTATTEAEIENTLNEIPWMKKRKPTKKKVSEETRRKIRESKKGKPRKNLSYDEFCALVDAGEIGDRMMFYVDRYPDIVRQKIEEDIIFLARDILGYKWDGKEGFLNPPDPVHIDMREFFDRQARYKLGIYPRGTYKSSLIAICRPIQYLCRDFEDTIGIIGETWDLARKRLKVIKTHLQYNSYLLKLYGEFIPQRTNIGSGNWNRNFIYIRQRKDIVKLTEPSIGTAGLDSKTTGWHPNHLIIDDPASDDNTTTSEQIQKGFDYLNGYVDLAGTSGDITILATPRKPDDQLTLIKKKWENVIDEVTDRKIFASRNMAVWNNEEEDDLIMPSKYSAKAIRTLRNTKTIKTFATQYLCDACAGGNTLVKKEHLDATQYFVPFADTHKDKDEKGKKNKKWWAYLAIDPGKSLNPKKCHTGAVLGIPMLPYDLYFDEALRLKKRPSEIVEDIINLIMQPHYLGHIRTIGVEINAFQEIYESLLQNAINKLVEKLEAEGKKEIAQAIKYIGFFPIQTQVGKDDRFYSMEPYYRHHQIHIRVGSPGLEFLRHQVGSYPNISDNNRDLLDASTFFREMLPQWLVNPYGDIDVDIKPTERKVNRPMYFPRKAGDEDYFRKRTGAVCY